MRVATLIGVGLFAGMVWLGACGPPYPGNAYCNGNGRDCSCHDEPSCVYDCPAGGCNVDCHNVDNCDLGCGDACKWDCHDAISCDGTCGDGCDAECHNASSCDIDCGADCNVDCHDNSSCSVRMISGEVNCHNNSSCDIQCVLPGGGTAPADNFKDNRWRC
jgi:hypothetical protein